jgi:hypothetical protein
MKETITGTVQGEYARRYPSYMYRKPVEEPLAPYELYADRVYWDRAYPMWTEGLPLAAIQCVELADYSITIEWPNEVGRLWVEIRMVPNDELTDARTPMLVRKGWVSHELFLSASWESWLNEQIREAFGPPRTTVNNCNNPPVTDA